MPPNVLLDDGPPSFDAFRWQTQSFKDAHDEVETVVLPQIVLGPQILPDDFHPQFSKSHISLINTLLNELVRRKTPRYILYRKDPIYYVSDR